MSPEEVQSAFPQGEQSELRNSKGTLWHYASMLGDVKGLSIERLG